MKAAISVRRVTRGSIPTNMPLKPVFWQMERTVCTSPVSADFSCTLVLTTSAGWVVIDASSPATRPQEKRSGGLRVSACVAVGGGGGVIPRG